MSSKNNLRSPATQSRRLAQFRQWHKWGGLTAGLMLLVLGTTGIVLNYKQPIFSRLGIESKRGDRDVSPLPARKFQNHVNFTTDGGISGAAVDFAAAVAIARTQWGDVPLERVEVRSERGSVTYRFRKTGGEELWIDAADGTHLVKGPYERIGKADATGTPTRQTDWAKILIDLHTGRMGGEAGKAVMSCAGLMLVLLTLSGVYLWAKPILNRRQNARPKVAGSGRSTQISVPTMSAARNFER